MAHLRQLIYLRKILIKVGVALLIIASGISLIFIMNIYVIPNNNSNTPTENEESNKPSDNDIIEYNINIIIKDKDSNILKNDMILADSNNLIDVLEKNYEIRYEREGVGVFLYDIGPLKTDKWNSYIAIYVNDKYSNYGIDRIVLAEGLKIEFRETKI